MNVIKGAMENYIECKVWLEEYNREIESYFLRMEGNTSSSVIGMPDGDIDPNADGRRKSAINDELNEFKEKNRDKFIHCTNTITLCDINFDLVAEEFREIFDLHFKQGKTMRCIEMKIPYSKSNIDMIITKETKRLSRL